jgi:N-acetylglucosaminyldiphosphoundecaprenol N-acetyl-beta-D-mannosaminyltransferase
MKEKNIRKYVNILGVKVIGTSKEALLREIQSRLKDKQKFYIVTPNPEQVIIAEKDEQYKDILNSADISIPDGIGLVAAAKFYSLPRPKSILKRALVLFAQGLGVGFSILVDRSWLETEMKQIKGREVFIELVKLANRKGLKVVLIGDGYQSAQKAAKKLKENFIKLEIYGYTGPDLKEDGRIKTKDGSAVEDKVIKQINKAKPDLLFIGFRAPVQEKWLYRWYQKLDFKCAMVVGGTFDYVSGKKKTPPYWIADMGLEWLWRILIADQKIKRVSKAFPEFALKIYWQKLVKNSG